MQMKNYLSQEKDADARFATMRGFAKLTSDIFIVMNVYAVSDQTPHMI